MVRPYVRPYKEKLPKPPKEVTCVCGAKFFVKGRGKGRTKYCVECRVTVYNINRHKQKRNR